MENNVEYSAGTKKHFQDDSKRPTEKSDIRDEGVKGDSLTESSKSHIDREMKGAAFSKVGSNADLKTDHTDAKMPPA